MNLYVSLILFKCTFCHWDEKSNSKCETTFACNYLEFHLLLVLVYFSWSMFLSYIRDFSPGMSVSFYNPKASLVNCWLEFAPRCECVVWPSEESDCRPGQGGYTTLPNPMTQIGLQQLLKMDRWTLIALGLKS